MSREIVQKIIFKAQKEPDFMKSLFENMDKTLKEYELTPEEFNFFKNSDQKTLEGLSPSCFELANRKK